MGGCTRARQADHGEPSDPDGFALASWSPVRRGAVRRPAAPISLSPRGSHGDGIIASPALPSSSALPLNLDVRLPTAG